MGQETALLQSTLDSILQRLSCLESSLGITPSSSTTTTTTTTTSSTAGSPNNATSNIVTEPQPQETTLPASLLAFDQHISKALLPFVQSCQALHGLSPIGTHTTTIWNSMRDMIQLASQCRKPSPTTNLQQETLAPYLESIQNAMKELRQLKLDRSYDWHIKAVMEMLVCVSWVIMTAPPAPSTFVKDTLGATEFWTNKIRKEYKLKPEKEIMQAVQIDFCDAIKGLILDLSLYVKEYHLSGLMWNPNGMDVADYNVKKVEQEGVGVKVGEGKSVASTSTTTTMTKATTTTTSSTSSSSSSSMQAVDFRKELAAKRSSDGNSAATGLRKVSREQQTWRKEYKATASGGAAAATTTTTTSVKPSMVKAAQKKQVEEDKIKYNLPTCQFQAVGNKWIVEYQTRDSQPSGVCTVEIQNPKEQVYIYKCNQATIQIKGKLKSIIMDSCIKTNVLFDTAISSCEIVNCQKVQIQSTGICPSFAIDKTDGCLVYLSSEAVSVSNFVTSKSSEMNVSWLDEKSGEQKEAPIPEQFVHKLVNGAISSDVSDLYH